MEAVSPAVTGSWPLVGRNTELAQIAAARADERCPAVVISAAAGVGKSRLAREACVAAEVNGPPSLWAQATASSATIPLGALAGLIPDEIRSDDPLELVRRSVTALRARGEGRTVLLAVDDAQLLDPMSAALVLQLAATPDVFVLATVRTGEPTPDAVDSLWKDEGARRIDLERISDEAIVELVEAGVGGPLDQLTMREIIDACMGNPLYARELVIGAVEDGRMRRERGLWRLEGRPAVTPSLTALITRRTGTLAPELRRPLELLALGEPMHLDELGMLTSYEALEACEERGMIAIAGPSPDADVRLAHPLYGEVIRAELAVLRARGHRLTLAEIIQQRRLVTPDDALRAARWLIDAGAEIPRELLLDAADAANLSGDPGLGADLARRAIDAGGGLRAVHLLARAHTVRNHFVDAAVVLADAETMARDDPEALDYARQRMHLLGWVLRRPDEARALLERIANWSSDPLWVQQVELWQIALAGLAEGFSDRLQAVRESLLEPDINPVTRRLRELILGVSLMSAGRGREAGALARRLRPRPPLVSDLDFYALGLASLVGEESGEDWGDLDAYMRATVQEAVRIGDHEAAGLAARTLGALDLQRGRYHDAERWLAEAELQLEHHDTLGGASCVHALQVGVACFIGDTVAAQAALEQMRDRVSERGQRPTELIYLACGESWAARAHSAADGAEAFMQRAAETDDAMVRSRLLHEALRSGARPRPVAQALAQLASEGDSVLTEARAAHAAAVAESDAQAFLAAGEQLVAIGCDAAAVEAIVAASREFLSQGRHDSARRAAVRARELHPASQGWELPLIDGIDGIATELTPREAQIATLAARGLTNQQIADQLVLSVRTIETIETYIYRAMQKRGVNNRRDL